MFEGSPGESLLRDKQMGLSTAVLLQGLGRGMRAVGLVGHKGKLVVSWSIWLKTFAPGSMASKIPYIQAWVT